MTRAQVEAILGPPDDAFDFASRTIGKRRYAAAYLFPRGLADRLARRPVRALPPLRMLGLLYAEGRLARIDTALGYGMASGRCPDGRLSPADGPPARDIAPRDFAPFTRFATLTTGEPIKAAARRLGREDTVSTAGDFRAFSPAPITLDGDPRLGGFSVSSDSSTEFEGFSSRLVLLRRAGDCRINGLRVDPPSR